MWVIFVRNKPPSSLNLHQAQRRHYVELDLFPAIQRNRGEELFGDDYYRDHCVSYQPPLDEGTHYAAALIFRYIDVE